MAGSFFGTNLRNRFQRKWCVGALAGISVAIIIWAAVADRRADGNSVNRQLSSLHEEVSNLKTQEEISDAERFQLKENLDSFQSAVEKMNGEQSANIAKVIEKFAQNAKVREMSDVQMYRRALALVKQLQEMHAKQSRERQAEQDAFRISSRSATINQLRQMAQQYRERSSALNRSHNLDFQMHALGETQYLDRELRRRLPDLPAPEGEVRIVLAGQLTGVDPLLQLANYFEIRIKKLVPNVETKSTVAQLSLR